MSTIETLTVIEDERRRALRRSELVRALQDARIHRRTVGDRIGRWLSGSDRRTRSA